MVPAPRRDDKPEHLFITRAAWIGFSGAIVAAVITIFPDLRPTGLDRLLERLAELTAAINGEMITIGPGGGIAHAEAAVHPGERVTLKNGDDVPHRIVVPGTQPAAAGGGEGIERSLQPGATLHINLTTVGAGLRPQVCDGLLRKAPRADIDAALEDPSSISGWDELRNPNLPEGPDNPRKHWLSMLDLNKPYNRLFNGLRFKAGCP